MTGHEPANAHAGQGPVLIEVDDHTGALILFAPADLEGAEIDVSPVAVSADGPGTRRHVAVLARRLDGEVVHAAVYPSLASGRWLVWSPDGRRPVLAVDVPPGGVVEARWPVTEDALAGA